MTTLAMRNIPSFDHTIDSWNTFRSRLGKWFITNKITVVSDATGDVRRDLLLSTFADATFDLTLGLTSPRELHEVPYEDILLLLDKKFKPKHCKCIESCNFYKATQETNETPRQWAERLRKLSAHCRFRNMEEALCNQFAMGMLPGQERNEFFAEDFSELTLDEAVELAETLRSTRIGASPSNEPPSSMQISELSGDQTGDIAEDDLPRDSDSCLSHKEEQCETPEIADNSGDEDCVKQKRSKLNAILSDTESSSDSEDLEEKENFKPMMKRSKRKNNGSESDASVGSSKVRRKRRRIEKQLSDSDGSASDTENQERNKPGRKNIRQIIRENELDIQTKKAAKEEKERIARVMERQKLYNNLDINESGKSDDVVSKALVLDFDLETKEPLISVDRGLVEKLKPHQENGIKFMWDACFESVKRIEVDRGSGCILAHCMGLGKTLQVISLIHTLLTHESLTGVSRVLVVCPLSTVLNWVNEFRVWLTYAKSDFEVKIYELSGYKENAMRAFQLQQWLDNGGVCILGYELFRILSTDNTKYKKKILKSFQQSLVDPGPHLVVCDEGHLLKNEKSRLSQSMNRVKTRRRIILTGTPLQNNLKEYYCMVNLVKPRLLGTYEEYLNRFVNPIINGQYTDSQEHDIRLMKTRSHVLHKLLEGAVQRRDYSVLTPFLPPKHEYVLFLTLSDVQVDLYKFYLENYSRRPVGERPTGFLFPDYQSLQRIWTHPLVLKYHSIKYEIEQKKKREKEEDSAGSLVDFIDDDPIPEEIATKKSSENLLDDISDESRKKSEGLEVTIDLREGAPTSSAKAKDDDADLMEGDDMEDNPTEWWLDLVSHEQLEDLRYSHKLVVLFDILKQCEAIGDKLLVFSQSLYSLDLIEHFLSKINEATQEGRIDEKLGGHVGLWSPGVDYFRMDGSTSCENRSIWCKHFNKKNNPRARLFLISTRAGGLGINLVAANRVVIFDVSWNPSHDVQSIFRVYRFGQVKPCYIYRFIAMGTMEETMYDRQVTKQAISKRVIDEQQIDRHYGQGELGQLYKFEARPREPRPLPVVPNDRLFAEILKERETQIYRYHDHDSLLENKEEETLSEEERKAAWEDFKQEKNDPPPSEASTSALPIHNITELLAKQQQMAFATISAMLRKDMPNMNDQQIRDMLPLIYKANPKLMQKMKELYKYAQS